MSKLAGYVRQHHLALLAIFLAVGGTGYAAGAAKNSVSSKSVKDNSLRGNDILDDSLTGADINEGTLQGTIGPQGPVGPQGPPGSPDLPADVLNKIKQVDGTGSGLDADTLDGSDSTEFARYKKTILVSPGANASASGAALIAAVQGAPTPSVTNPILLKLEPGTYDIGSDTLELPDGLSLEGSGYRTTFVRHSSGSGSAVEVTGASEVSNIGFTNTVADPASAALTVATPGTPVKLNNVNAFAAGAIGLDIDTNGTVTVTDTFAQGVPGTRLESGSLNMRGSSSFSPTDTGLEVQAGTARIWDSFATSTSGPGIEIQGGSATVWSSLVSSNSGTGMDFQGGFATVWSSFVSSSSGTGMGIQAGQATVRDSFVNSLDGNAVDIQGGFANLFSSFASSTDGSGLVVAGPTSSATVRDSFATSANAVGVDVSNNAFVNLNTSTARGATGARLISNSNLVATGSEFNGQGPVALSVSDSNATLRSSQVFGSDKGLVLDQSIGTLSGSSVFGGTTAITVENGTLYMTTGSVAGTTGLDMSAASAATVATTDLGGALTGAGTPVCVFSHSGSSELDAACQP
ncbi:MAG: hypothetical protein QOG62_1064 [Thermoleophilaceae bacterium]|nr:hypothetical protein [Thermoleophilaceae bacterium]